MATNEKKGITVKVDAELHAEVRRHIEEHEMTMGDFVALALQNELHPILNIQEGKTMGNMRTMAFQVPEELFQKIKDYLQRNNMTQKQFVIGLIENEIERYMAQCQASSETLTNSKEMREKHTEQHETAAVSYCESFSDEVGDVAEERNNDAALNDFEIEDTDEDEKLDVDQAKLLKVNGYLKRAIERSEKMVLGNERTLPTIGYYVCPTIFDNISPSSELFTDEVFGPVLTVTTFEDEKDAIRLANNSEYGLAASVWTKDIDRMHRLASSIKCGIMQCNTIFCEFPGAPAGGYKNSGYGREFGKEAITEYTQIKTVWVSYSDNYLDWV